MKKEGEFIESSLQEISKNICSIHHFHLILDIMEVYSGFNLNWSSVNNLKRFFTYSGLFNLSSKHFHWDFYQICLLGTRRLDSNFMKNYPSQNTKNVL